MQPFAQIRIGDAQHAGTRVRLHALDGGLRGQAGHHRFGETVLPAAVVGEHAIGFEHVAVLSAVGDLAALEQDIEIRTHGLDCGFQALHLFRHVVGDEIGDDDARLVQHYVAERDAVVEHHALDLQRPPRRGLRRARPRERRKLARGDHLGQHHRGGLQRLLFLFGIGAPRAVLHHQHAERVAGAQHRHAEEGVVDFFAGFRPVGEGRVALRL